MDAQGESCSVDPDLLMRLESAYGVEKRLAARIVEEVLHAYGETAEEWIRSEHIRLQRQGICNEEIYSRIAAELPKRRFTVEELTLRQIRRMIYG